MTSAEENPEVTNVYLSPTFFQQTMASTSSRITALEKSDVCRVSGSEDFYCTACNVHISHIEAAETHVKSNYHRNNLRASRISSSSHVSGVDQNPSQGGVSYSPETEEDLEDEDIPEAEEDLEDEDVSEIPGTV